MCAKMNGTYLSQWFQHVVKYSFSKNSWFETYLGKKKKEQNTSGVFWETETWFLEMSLRILLKADEQTQGRVG